VGRGRESGEGEQLCEVEEMREHQIKQKGYSRENNNYMKQRKG
jgi:hypothetical protein